MRRLPLLVFLPLLPLTLVPRAAAQTWNDETVLGLVARAAARRAGDPARGLRDFQARAHGFVFFLAQLGEDQLNEPPHLVKADQLVLEVYWRAPGTSKQRIVGWRDRVDLPTEIAYHRDHLGIVQNGFADRIRLGEGQEVRDVPHPLAPGGAALYDFALVDSTTIRLPARTVRVHEVAFRPKDPAEPRIAGTLYLDADGGELVRLRFSFTRAAYRDPSLEDITVLLDNGLWEQRYWLPRRQEIEIRRRTTWLELPARGIIRGRWEIDDYAFDVGLAAERFLGPEIVAAPPAVRDSFRWDRSLDAAIAAAAGDGPGLTLEDARAEIRRLVADRALSGLAPARPAVGGLSDLLHVNRVEGLAVGAGYLLRPAGRTSLRAWAGYGFGDDRLKARLEAAWRIAGTTVALTAAREVRDIADEPVIAPLLNSLVAQEAGRDYGDYVLMEHARLSLRQAFTPGVALTLAGGVERTTSVGVAATPARGSFRANPALGAGTLGVGAVRLELGRGSRPAGLRWSGRVDLDGGPRAGSSWLRGRIAGEVLRTAGPLVVELAGRAGLAGGELPPYREFVLGGRGTLAGAPFRAWGGRRMAYARLDVGAPVPAPAVPLGPFASTGRQALLGPFVAVGWAADPDPGLPWTGTGGVQAVLGLRLEWFHRLLRAEMGWWPAGGAVGLIVDVRHDLWPIL